MGLHPVDRADPASVLADRMYPLTSRASTRRCANWCGRLTGLLSSGETVSMRITHRHSASGHRPHAHHLDTAPARRRPDQFSLEGDRLTVDSGRKVSEVRLGAVDLVRMTYEPGRFAQKAYRTKVMMKDGKTFTFRSLNWKSLVEAQELAPEYRAFSRGSAATPSSRANPEARLRRRQAPWPVARHVGYRQSRRCIAMAMLIWRAFQTGADQRRADRSAVRARGHLADRADGPAQQAALAVRPEGAACRNLLPPS